MNILFRPGMVFCTLIVSTSCKQRTFNNESSALSAGNTAASQEISPADSMNSCIYKNEIGTAAVTFYADKVTPKFLTVTEKSAAAGENSASHRYDLIKNSNSKIVEDIVYVPVEKTGINFSIHVKKTTENNSRKLFVLLQNDSIFADGTSVYKLLSF